MMMIGTVTTTEAAEIAPIGCSNWDAPVKNASAAGTVRAASVEVSVFAKMKSFQAKMKTRIEAVKTPGAARTISSERLMRRAATGPPVRAPGDLAAPDSV